MEKLSASESIKRMTDLQYSSGLSLEDQIAARLVVDASLTAMNGVLAKLKDMGKRIDNPIGIKTLAVAILALAASSESPTEEERESLSRN